MFDLSAATIYPDPHNRGCRHPSSTQRARHHVSTVHDPPTRSSLALSRMFASPLLTYVTCCTPSAVFISAQWLNVAGACFLAFEASFFVSRATQHSLPRSNSSLGQLPRFPGETCCCTRWVSCHLSSLARTGKPVDLLLGQVSLSDGVPSPNDRFDGSPRCPKTDLGPGGSSFYFILGGM